MANNVKVLFKSFLQGGPGFTSTGSVSQNKQLVVARMEVTNYANGTGETLTPADLGLSTVDLAQCSITTAGGMTISESSVPVAHYDIANELVYISEIAAAAAAAGATDDPVVSIWAVGDSAAAPELT